MDNKTNLAEQEKLYELLKEKTDESLAYFLASYLVHKDVKVQKKARWIFNDHQAPGEPLYFCSLCTDGESERGRDNFCNHCGAEMEHNK